MKTNDIDEAFDGPARRAPNPAPVRRADWAGLAGGALLAAGLIAIYGRTFSVPFLFDDGSSIPDNLSIRRLWPLWPVFSPPADAGVGGRPLLNLSYALNYAFGGMSVSGYHWVNLLIHLLAACTLFALVRRTLRRPVLAERFGSAATLLALAVSAIWAWHPVLTESVTYLSQRAESMMGLFYLLTLYCFARGAEKDDKRSRWIWFPLSVLSCVAGVGTKEVIVTAPLMAFLHDRTFISGSFSGAWRRHWPAYLALAAPLLRFIGVHHPSVGFGHGIAWWAYGLAECRVVVKYLLLALWPHPLIFDYGPEAAAVQVSQVWPYIVILASLLTATVVALRRSPAAAFAACWFFLILAPTSSIVPVATQPMAENRLYLSLAGVVAFVVLGGYALAGRRSLPVFAVLAAALGLAAVHRNRDYSSELAIWSDTVAKNPANLRAHNNLGSVFSNLPGRSDDAIAQFEEVLHLKPEDAVAHNNLGSVWALLPGRTNDAIAQFEEALRLKPDYAEAHDNLGKAWSDMPGRTNDAIAQFEEALRLKPDFAGAYNDRGEVWMNQPGRLNDAIAQFEEALRLKPDFAEAHNNLGAAWAHQPGRMDGAIAQFEEALRLKPDYAEAHSNLGNAWSNLPGRMDDAIAQLEEAVHLKPEYAEAHNNLGNAWFNLPGRMNDAIAQYKEAVRLKPDYAEAHNNLGNALAHLPGRMNDAVTQFEAAVRLKPDFAEAHNNLGTAFFNLPGRMGDAVAQYEAAVRLQPDYVQAHFNLAVALLNLPGRGDEARAQLETVLRLQPENAPARQILARMQAAQS